MAVFAQIPPAHLHQCGRDASQRESRYSHHSRYYKYHVFNGTFTKIFQVQVCRYTGIISKVSDTIHTYAPVIMFSVSQYPQTSGASVSKYPKNNVLRYRYSLTLVFQHSCRYPRYQNFIMCHHPRKCKYQYLGSSVPKYHVLYV